MLLFDISKLKFAYKGNKKILDIEELKIKKNKITILSGPNGSGKTTLLKILSGFYDFSSAKYKSAFKKEDINFLPQEPYLLKRSVKKNIEYGLKLRKESDIDLKTALALDMVGLDYSDYSKRKWFELSGGEKKRVAFAARLALKPKVLILDEPSEGVDYLSRYHLAMAIKKAKKNWGASVIISSHDRSWVSEIGEEFFYIINGRAFNGGFLNIINGVWVKGDRFIYQKHDHNYFIKSDRCKNLDKLAIISPELLLIEKYSLDKRPFANYFCGILISSEIVSKDKNLYCVESGDKKIFVISKNKDFLTGEKVVLSFDEKDLLWI